MELSITRSDSISESENANSAMDFTRKFESESVSSDEDTTNEQLIATYRLLYTKWEENCLTVENHKKTICVFQKETEKLVSTIIGLEEVVALLNLKLKNMTKFMCMLNNGTNMINEILEVGKMSRNLNGIGFESNMNKKMKIPYKKFVLPKKKTEFQMLDHMPQHHA